MKYFEQAEFGDRFWQPKYHAFEVFTRPKPEEKLEYMPEPGAGGIGEACRPLAVKFGPVVSEAEKRGDAHRVGGVTRQAAPLAAARQRLGQPVLPSHGATRSRCEAHCGELNRATDAPEHESKRACPSGFLGQARS
jgi:hypothetical protein